jgi:hypothetical protein
MRVTGKKGVKTMHRTVVFGVAFVLAMCVVGRTAHAAPETYDFSGYVLGSKVLDPSVPLPGFLVPCNCDPFVGPGFSGTLVVDLDLPPEQRLLSLHIETPYDDNTTIKSDLDVVPGHPENKVVALTSSQLAGNVPPPHWEIVSVTGRTGPRLPQAGRSIGISLQWSGEPGAPRQYPANAHDVDLAKLTPRTSWRMTFTLSDASAVYATSFANVNVVHRRGTGGLDYHETFSDGTAPGWTPQGSGQWSAATGDLRNATNTSFTSNTIEGLELPVQFVMLADVYLSWGASGNTAGLLLNYHGPGDFYELRLNARGTWRLDEVRGGVRRARYPGASFLNAGTRRWHSIYVKRTGFRGEEWEIHINGERVLSDLIDPFEPPFPIVGGTVGVFASWNLARFDNVVIGAPIGRGPQGMQAFDTCCGNPPNFTGESGTWTIENGYMRSSANQAASIATLNNWHIFEGRVPPVYGISGRIYLEWSGAGNWGGFMYDYIDARNYREVRVSRSVPGRLGAIVLAETVNGVWREVFRAPRLLSSTDREVWLTLTRENDRTIVHELNTVSNIQVRQARPTVPLLSGLGLFAAWNQVRFDDVVVY